jgi:mRNA-degrading endonuclease RelE of RelBE toxin-antitoxin system
MEFRIADTFTASLAKLTDQEQKAVKTTAFDFQLNPSSPGHQFHKLDKAKDKCFWSVRVNRDVRIIVHRTDQSLMLCFVAHHDDAYSWAERRKIEVHPKTGAAQLVEIRERVEEVVHFEHVNQQVRAEARRPVFAEVSDGELESLGVTVVWFADVKKADEDSLLDLIVHLPQEAGEALLELAVGGKPKPFVAAAIKNPYEHPDSQRRFKVIANAEELQRALDFPWDKWTVFLHPSQHELVDKDFSGPARVAGSAGTGKTVVALHRAVTLARRHPKSRVLLTTFSDPLAHALAAKLYRLAGNEPH